MNMQSCDIQSQSTNVYKYPDITAVSIPPSSKQASKQAGRGPGEIYCLLYIICGELLFFSFSSLFPSLITYIFWESFQENVQP